MGLKQLIYVSSACIEHGDAELQRILESSVRHNRQNGITGLLLYGRGTFVQVLEGASEAIDETMGRILVDRRHSGVIIIETMAIAEREFGDWFMAYRRLDDAVLSATNYLPLFEADVGCPAFAQASDTVVGLLRDFVSQAA